MNRVIAITNQKGGVGKTTTAVNLAASLTATKRRVLLIDLDPQGNATMGCGIDKHTQLRTSCDVLLGDCAASEALVPVEYGGFMLLPANQDLTAAEVRLLTMLTGREFKLRNALQPIRENFDVILIDCPPSLNMLTLNALVAADSVMVPMQCEYYALEGLSALVQTIEQIRGSINAHLEIEGLLRTMFDPRNNLSNEVSAQLVEHFGEKVFRTLIPRNIRLAEAPSFGKPVLFHDRESRGALAYLALAGEMIRRDEPQGPAAEMIPPDESQPLVGEMIPRSEPQPPAGEMIRRDEAQPPAGEMIRRDEPQGPAGEMIHRDEAQPPAGEMIRRDEAQPPAGEMIRRDEAQPPAEEMIRRDEAQPPAGEMIRRDEAQPPAGEMIRRDEAQPPAGEMISRDEPQPPAGEMIRRDEPQPPAGEMIPRDEPQPPVEEMILRIEPPAAAV